MNQIKTFIIICFICFLIGGFTIRSIFPRKIMEQNNNNIIEYKIDSIMVKKFQGKIDSLNIELNKKPKIIYRDKIVNGQTIIDSIKIYPKGHINIYETSPWNKVFENIDRDNDELSFDIIGQLKVSAYVDSIGKEYIGYDDFSIFIENLKLKINPKIINNNYIQKFKLYINSGFNINEYNILNNNVIQVEYDLSLCIGLCCILEDKYIIGINYGQTSKYKQFGINCGIKLFGFGKQLKKI